jgi:hypothetical protein
MKREGRRTVTQNAVGSRVTAAHICGYARTGPGVRSVMVAGCEDDDLCLCDDVDETMLLVDPP